MAGTVSRLAVHGVTGRLRYLVIGSGRQGAATAFFLARWGSAQSVLLADRDPDAASLAAARINRLVKGDIVRPRHLEVSDTRLLTETLASVDIAVCAVPFSLILACTRAAITAGTSMVDLGGHTETVMRQLDLDGPAKQAGVTIVPDCGMGPGMSNMRVWLLWSTFGRLAQFLLSCVCGREDFHWIRLNLGVMWRASTWRD